MKNAWMRNKKVNILNYLPYFLSKDARFKALNLSDSEEQERLRLAVQDLLNQLFIDTATWSLKLWEEFCGIATDEKADYKSRRGRVLDILNGKQTVTFEFITKLINRYVVDKSGFIIPHYDQYYVDVMVPDSKVSSFSELEKMLRIYMPAHLGWKYIAYINQKTDIYFGGIVSGYSVLDIPADTSFDITINEPATPAMPGVVGVGTYINIPAEFY